MWIIHHMQYNINFRPCVYRKFSSKINTHFNNMNADEYLQ